MAAQANAQILWNFNGLAFRSVSSDGSLGPWDPRGNATAILDYVNSKYGGRGGINWGWSLGNEPEFWKATANFTQLGLDALALQSLLRANYSVGSDVYGPSLGGLDVQPFAEFLNATRGNVAGVTVHNYPLGRDCNVPAYLNRSAIDALGARLAALVETKHA